MSKRPGIKAGFQLFIMLILAFSLAACGSNNDSKQPSNSTGATESAASIDAASSAPASAISSPEPAVVSPNSATPSPTSSTAAPSASPKPTPALSSESPSSSHAPATTSTPTKVPPPTPEAVKGVTLSIIGDDKIGVIMEAAVVPIEGEISVLSLLQKETRAQKIQMEFSGKGIFGYVNGIANLYEFDRGEKSGWLFKVNGAFSSKGAGSYKIKAGDRVEWLYTLDLGKDIGDKP